MSFNVGQKERETRDDESAHGYQGRDGCGCLRNHRGDNRGLQDLGDQQQDRAIHHRGATRGQGPDGVTGRRGRW